MFTENPHKEACLEMYFAMAALCSSYEGLSSIKLPQGLGTYGINCCNPLLIDMEKRFKEKQWG